MIAHPTWMEINNKQLLINWQALRNHIGKRLFCLPVKANSYGHGLVEVSTLAESSGLVDYLGVSCSDEALILRQAKIKLPILVFGAIHKQQLNDLIQTKAHITISSLDKAKMLLDFCKQNNKEANIHLEIETGMNRTGMRPSTALKTLDYLRQTEISQYLKLKGIYTHLACSGNGPGEASVAAQLKAFALVSGQSEQKDIIYHAANSGGIMFYPDSYEKMGMVRPGILAYGLFDEKYQAQLFPEIKSCVSLKSKISYFKVVAPGEGVSYGHTYHTKKQTRIVTVPIGYGDGYMRCMSHKAQVLIRGKRYPIVGTINMDQLMVDIGDGDNEAYVGDEVVLIGKQGNEEISVFDLARWANTVTYEIMCAFSQRVPRLYI